MVAPEAYDAYLRERYHFGRLSIEDLPKSIEYLESAIRIDPGYADAYGALAQAYSMLPNLYLAAPEEGFGRAKALARMALSPDETNMEAHIALAWSWACYDYRWTEAEGEFRRAVELAPSSALAHARYGWFLSWVGRHDAAIQQQRLAVKLDPLYSFSGNGMVASLLTARRYDEAIDEGERTLSLHPDSVFGHIRLGLAYAQSGRLVEARESFERASRYTTDPVRPKLGLAFVGGLNGERERADRMLEEVRRSERGELASFDVASVYAALGERDEALELLERSYTVHDPNMVLLKEWPLFDGIRDDERYRDLVRRMKFPS